MDATIEISDAIIVSGAANNITMMLREVLRRNGFAIASQQTGISDVQEAINQGHGKLLVIDDTPDIPASFALRSLFRDPVCCLTPTVVLTSKNVSGSDESITSIGIPTLLKKPLTPDQFIPTLKALKTRWAEPDFQTLLKARKNLIDSNHESALRELIKLCTQPEVQKLASPAVAWYYRKAKNLRIAEKLLLTTLTSNPSNTGIILALSELYMHAAMPATAKKLLEKARGISFGRSLAIDIDLTQANLLLGKLRDTLPILEQTIEAEKMTELLSPILLKILCSEGLHDRSKKVSKRKQREIDAIEKAWEPRPAAPEAMTAADISTPKVS